MNLPPFRPALPLAAWLGLAAHALAQGQAAPPVAPSQVTPQAIRPVAPPMPPAPLLLTSPPLALPAGAEQTFFVPGSVRVAGQYPELADASQAILQALVGQRVAVAAVFEAAARLEQAYLAAGYALVRIVVPAQALADGGPVNLELVDGFIEAVDVAGVPAPVRALVQQRTQALVGQRKLRLDEIEHRLLLAGEAPGLRLRSTLATGAQPGGTLLVLDGSHRAWSAAWVADNRLSPQLQRWQLGPAVSANSPFGWGEQVYLLARVGADLSASFSRQPRLRILGLGAALPLGALGLTLGAEVTQSRTRALPQAGVLDSEGRFDRALLRATWPLRRAQGLAVNLNLTAEHLQQSLRALDFGLDLSRDRYTSVKASADAQAVTRHGTTLAVALTAARGLGGRDAQAAQASGVPLSRQGAGPRFSKWGLALQVQQPLPWAGLSLDLSTASQWAPGRALLQSEQLALDGAGLVSAWSSGALAVDSGHAARLELQRPVALAWGHARHPVTPYVFAALGRGRLAQPTAVEQARLTARAWGLGLRASVPDAQGLGVGSAAIEWAEPLRGSTAPDTGGRLTLSLGLNF